jgi:hypothetical protein
MILRCDLLLLLLLLVTSKLSQFNAGHASFIRAEVWISPHQVMSGMLWLDLIHKMN